MTPDLAASERRELCELLAAAGPDAPTLCEGWDAHDLACHLLIRESCSLAALGILVPGLAARTRQAMARLRSRHDFDELVALIRRGPRRRSPWRTTRLATWADSLEFFVHHEDLRRAGRGRVRPRVLSRDQDDWLWSTAIWLASRRLRRPGCGVLLQRVVDGRPGREFAAVVTGRQPVTVRGEAQELVLWLTGRGRVAELEFVGEEARVRPLKQARLGM